MIDGRAVAKIDVADVDGGGKPTYSATALDE